MDQRIDNSELDPYREVVDFGDVMRRRRSISAVFVLLWLLVPPVAWSCESTGMESCGTSYCPMLNPQGAKGCHEPETSIQQGSSGCEEAGEALLAYCLVPVEQDPVHLDSPSLDQQVTVRVVTLAGRVEIKPPIGPPDRVREAISSRQHELGRFTLLSSFLL